MSDDHKDMFKTRLDHNRATVPALVVVEFDHKVTKGEGTS